MSKKRALETEIDELKAKNADLEAQMALIHKQQATMDAHVHHCCDFKKGFINVCSNCKVKKDMIYNLTAENIDKIDFSWPAVFFSMNNAKLPTWERCKNIECENLKDFITTSTSKRRLLEGMDNIKLKKLIKGMLLSNSDKGTISYEMAPFVTEYLLVAGKMEEFDFIKRMGPEMGQKWIDSIEFSALKAQYK